MRTLTALLPVALALLVGTTATPQAAELRLRLLETTDVHMNLLNYDYYQDKPTDDYGLAKTITLIKVARAEAKNSLLFDNGDLLQGSPLGDWVARVRPAYFSDRGRLFQSDRGRRNCVAGVALG